MVVVQPFQVVARLALASARDHGFALAGGHALIAHGLVRRPTEDVDLFTDEEGGAPAAAEPVAAALSAAGFTVTDVTETGELGDLFDGFDLDMVEFEVSRDGQTTRLQLARFDRVSSPVVMDVGPVLSLDDVLGTKVAALATRAYPRDFVDISAALDRYSRDRLIEMGLRSDPALTDAEFAEAMDRLDRLDDTVFELYGLTARATAQLRARFADWPRAESDIDRSR